MDISVLILIIVGIAAAAFIALKIRKSFKKADCGSCCDSCKSNCKK